MTFYCISNSEQTRSVQLLATACKQRSIHFEIVSTATYNFARPNTLKPGDLLYRIAADKKSSILEKYLFNSNIRTLYIHNSFPQRLVFNDIFIAKAGLAIPKTIFNFTSDRGRLNEYVDYINGFPIILKVGGGSHGIGVIKVDSMPALISLADYLVTTNANIMMREFIPHQIQARLIVLGDKVIDSISYTKPDSDFRTNTGLNPTVKPQIFKESYQNMAIRTVEILGVHFGGVDIIIGQDDKPYITEINFPCNFARSQDTTGTDIAGLMIDFLLAKQLPSI